MNFSGITSTRNNTCAPLGPRVAYPVVTTNHSGISSTRNNTVLHLDHGTSTFRSLSTLGNNRCERIIPCGITNYSDTSSTRNNTCAPLGPRVAFPVVMTNFSGITRG